MVKSKIDKDTLNSIERYVSEISKYYKIDYIILFGSYVKGTHHKDSDIDIAVVSKDIKDCIDDGAKLISLTWGIDTRIEPHAINTEEFDMGSTPFIDEIIETGIKIYAA